MSKLPPVVPSVTLSFALSDPAAPPGAAPLVGVTITRPAGADRLSDMEANALRLAEQVIHEAFRRLAEAHRNGTGAEPQ